MKRWFSRLSRMLTWPVRAPGRAWRALRRSEPFPDVSWGYLLRFARLPLFLVGIVVAIYVLGLFTFITAGNRWSAAEVFVGLAGGGAALASLAGLAKQFETPRPELAFQSEFDGETEQWSLWLLNKGSEARRVEAVVHGVRTSDLGAGPAGRFGRHWQERGWERDFEEGWDMSGPDLPWTCEAGFTDELKAGDRVDLGTFEFVKHGRIRVTCSNGQAAYWVQPRNA